MIKPLLTRVGVAVGGLALSFTGGAGIASADPDLGSIINTTCSEEQVVSALKAVSPGFAKQFNSDPQQLASLRTFLASSPNQRQQLAQQFMDTPGNALLLPTFQQAFSTCNSF